MCGNIEVTDLDELDCSLNEVAGHLNAQHACLVDLTVNLLAHEDWWAGPGIHSPELYLTWRTGISPARARQVAQIARRDGQATNANGWRLPDAIRRYITCDGLITPTFLADGIPVSVGRTQRIIPERTRRIVQHRDCGQSWLGHALAWFTPRRL